MLDSNGYEVDNTDSDSISGLNNTLPPELILHILTHISNPRELTICMLVCEQWRQLLNNYLTSYVDRNYPGTVKITYVSATVLLSISMMLRSSTHPAIQTPHITALSLWYQSRQLYRAPHESSYFSDYAPLQPLTRQHIAIFEAAKAEDIVILIKALRAVAPKDETANTSDDKQLLSTKDLYPLFSLRDYNHYTPLNYCCHNQAMLNELFNRVSVFYKNDQGEIDLKKEDPYRHGIVFWAVLFNQLGFFAKHTENDSLTKNIEDAFHLEVEFRPYSEMNYRQKRAVEWSDAHPFRSLLEFSASYAYGDLFRLLSQSVKARSTDVTPQSLITALIESGQLKKMNVYFRMLLNWQNRWAALMGEKPSLVVYVIDAIVFNRPSIFNWLVFEVFNNNRLNVLYLLIDHPNGFIPKKVELSKPFTRNQLYTYFLHLAVDYDREEIVKRILEDENVSINALDGRISTPLSIAVCKKQPNRRIIHLLLNAGAKVLLLDGGGYSSMSPFFIARDARTLQLLLPWLIRECTPVLRECAPQPFQFYLAERLVHAVKHAQLGVVKFILDYQRQNALTWLDHRHRNRCLNELHSSFMREERLELEDHIYPLQRIKVLLWERFSNKESGDAYASREELDVIYSGFKKQHGSSTVVSQRWRNVEESSRGEDDSEEGQSTEPRTGPGA